MQDSDNIDSEPKKKRPLWPWFIGAAIVAVIFLCANVYFALRGLAEAFVQDHPVTYTMPVKAKVITEYTSLADPFGDFDYCDSFTVSDSEYDKLLQTGWDWFKDSPISTDAPAWNTGRTRLSAFEMAGSCFSRLAQISNEITEYRFLISKGNDHMWLIAINEKTKIIYYYRGSW